MIITTIGLLGIIVTSIAAGAAATLTVQEIKRKPPDTLPGNVFACDVSPCLFSDTEVSAHDYLQHADFKLILKNKK